ncbi:MAG: glycoside hydrolase N-terminal domain-containing protein [Verrucomicrobia bacterium]|nr:glycoside hydrolase N-terminal domain-containing protein [Verrucomicrobiota bacterium]
MRHGIHYTAPVSRWDEGLPLGNGLLGLLVWGDPATAGLNLSVDRSDLWDNRPDPATKHKDFNWKKLTQLIDRNDMKSVYRIFEHQKRGLPYPTKLPCGRVRLKMPNVECRAQSAEDRMRKDHPFDSRLDFATGISATRIGPAVVSAYVHAELPLIVVRVRGAKPKVDFLSPFDRRRAREVVGEANARGIEKLGYPALERGTRNGVQFIRQQCAGGMSYAVAWETVAQASLPLERKWRRSQAGTPVPPLGEEWLLYLTVQMAENDRDPIQPALQVLSDAKEAGPVRLEKSHSAWWRRYWSKGRVHLPDSRIERLWYAEMYKLGAAARENTLPIALQGVWTADEMSLPPWRGDYHHDLNTEMTYWPVHTAGRLAPSLGFAKWLRRLLPSFQAFARDFYGAPGANVPCSQGANGELARGWAAYVYSRANAAWLIQHLWWHYRYTMDADFLRAIAWPFIREVARFCVASLTKERDGRYHIHYSSSPEYFHNWRESFAKDSTYDLALIRYALEIASASARILKVDDGQAQEWDRVRARLQPYHLAPQRKLWPLADRGLAIWEGQGLTESHRHPAQCMPIFPLGDLNIEGSDADRLLIKNTLGELDVNGTGWWCGYSFSWYACLGARVRQPNRALRALNAYLDHFTSPNTFHLNGDYKGAGVSWYNYRPFTVEGNFGAAHAVNEMLLQSWGDKIRLFPAVPPEWKDVSFTDLRAEGAFRVSAWRKQGRFVRAEIVSEKGQPVRLEHPAPGQTVIVRGIGRRFGAGKDIRFPTRSGNRYTVQVSP